MAFPLWVIGVLMSALASFANTMGLTLQKKTHQSVAEEKAKAEAEHDKLKTIEEKAGGPSGGAQDAILEEDEEEDAGIEEEEVSTLSTSDSVKRAATGEIMMRMDTFNETSMKALSSDPPGHEGDVDEEATGEYYTRPVWLLGMACVVLGAIFDVISFGFAPQSMLAPMSALSLVFNTLVAPRILGEHLSRRDIFATGIIVAGTIVVVSFAPKATPEYTVHTMRHLYMRPIVFVYAIVIAGVCFVLFGIMKKRKRETGEPVGMWKWLYPFAFATQAGVVGAQSVLFSKCGIELIKTSIAGKNQMIYPEIYIFILLIAVFIYLQVLYLNDGLALYDALYVIPVYQVFWMIVGILGGGIFFDEFSTFDSLQWGLFPLGCFITMAGIYLLTQRDHLKVVLDADGEPGLSKDGTANILALSAQAKSGSVFFGARNSVMVAMGNVSKPLDFSLPPVWRHRRDLARRMSRNFLALPSRHSVEPQRRASAIPATRHASEPVLANQQEKRRYSEMPSVSRSRSKETNMV